ncbi:hypothetical protein [Sulfurihydrogenibium sp.]|jgi:hypothetical protein|uniref:hypothetical protein n=1 Tax=Sulfurihydrogenibium sp. TaxID=2053621 RepID=UPI00260334DE|nr:hypothetical protein [Sulfurihydrogenibium sp.]
MDLYKLRKEVLRLYSLQDDEELPNGVILQPAKNLLFFFSSQKSKEEILRTYVLRRTDKGKLVKIL